MAHPAGRGEGMSTTAIALTVDYTLAEQEIGTAWQNCQRPNLEFGKVCYDWREKFSAQGSRTGQGLAQILRKLEINEGTAYYWIYRYEVSIGKRAPKEKKKPVTPDVVMPELDDESTTCARCGKVADANCGCLLYPEEQPKPDELVNALATLVSVHQQPAKKFMVKERETIQEMYVWEMTDVDSTDHSHIWLVENLKTGEAELWRTCDIRRLKQGLTPKLSLCEMAYRHSDPNGSNEKEAGLTYWNEKLVWAQKRLAELKATLKPKQLVQSTKSVEPTPEPTIVNIKKGMLLRIDGVRKGMLYEVTFFPNSDTPLLKISMMYEGEASDGGQS
jgi:transposase-like protein